MEFSTLLDKRRSCRSYTGAPIKKKQLDYIMYAAVHAPSACNKQSWHFTVICDREKIKKFAPDYTVNNWIVNCGAVIIVSTDKEGIEKLAGERGKNLFSIQDTACAIENMLLAATDIGLAGCFIGAFDAVKCFDDYVKDDRYTPVAIVAIGEPTEEPPMRERRPMDEVVTVIGIPD